MTYARVIPRDLFNEGDLLNCLGRLWIKLDETRGHRAALRFYGAGQQDFGINQDPSDGSIGCSRVVLSLDGSAVPVRRPLNARSRWPIYARIGDEDLFVFDANGELSPEFRIAIAAEPEQAQSPTPTTTGESR